jgi:hypothetical protein
MVGDADGIYLIVQGNAKIVNKCDQGEVGQLEVNQTFGDSKFVVVPSASYFGDIIACQPFVESNTTVTNAH